mgnify:CR=1 FL=1
MDDHSDIELEDIQTLDGYFDTFGDDREAAKHLVNLFLERMYDVQTFMQEGRWGVTTNRAWRCNTLDR